jgi:hypothetical protein
VATFTRRLRDPPVSKRRQVPSIGDEDYDEDEVAQIEHFNSQATIVLLTSLSREEYNKVQGLKSAKEVWDVLNELDGPSTSEAQPVAFKATEEKKESTSIRQPIDASKLDNEEMALVIKSFRQILKQRRGKDYKPRSKIVCYKCGKPDHFIAKCPIERELGLHLVPN